MSRLDELCEALKKAKTRLTFASSEETLHKADYERAQQFRRSAECELANAKEALLKEIGS